MAVPTIVLELCTSKPTTAAGSKVWVDITSYLRGFTTSFGRQSDTRSKFGTNQQRWTLKDDGRFRQANTGGAYYPNLKTNRDVRAHLVWGGNSYWIGTGRIESINSSRVGPRYAEVEMVCNDAWDAIAQRFISTGHASRTGGGVTLNGRTRTDRYTNSWWSNSSQEAGRLVPPGGYSVNAGAPGAQVALQIDMVAIGLPLSVTVEDDGTYSVVHVKAPSGTTAQEAADAINSHGIAGRLVNASPSGSGGSNVSTFAKTGMSGGYPAELSHLRIGRVLDAIGWPAAARVIGTGTATIQPMVFDTTDRVSALQHMQDVETSEDGQLFVNWQGYVVFQGRTARGVSPFAAPVLTVTDTTPGAGEFAALEINAAEDSAMIYNSVTVTRAGGASPASASDSTSKSDYDQRDLAVDTLLNADSDCSTLASRLLSRYKTGGERYESIVVSPGAVPAASVNALWDVLTTTGVSHRVRIKETPPGSVALQTDCYIEGGELTADVQSGSLANARMTYYLSPV